MSVPQDRRRAAAVARRLALAACLAWPAVLVALLRPRAWPLELATQLHMVYLWVLLPAIALSLIVRKWRLAIAHGTFAVLSLWFVAPVWVGADEPLVDAPTFDVVLANVHSQNRDHDRFLELMREDPPDVAVVLEVDDVWLAAAYAHIRTLRMADGPDEVHREVIARLELRKES